MNMRLGWMAFVAAVVLAIGSNAQAAPLPAGSYGASCDNVRASRDLLRARCTKRNGKRVGARLEKYSSCVGGISNYDGKLICLRRNQLPKGSWAASCRNPHLTAPGVFAAECKSPKGGRSVSQVALSHCPAGVKNLRGRLSCEAQLAAAPKRAKTAAAPAKPAPAAPAPAPVAAEPRDADQPPVEARDESDAEDDAYDETELPRGSYQRSCRSLDYDGQLLTGECRDREGAWREARLDMASCGANRTADNDDGALVCAGGTSRELPSGSYLDTCRNLALEGRFIRGQCRDTGGSWQDATFDTQVCARGNDIANVDGEIVCKAHTVEAAPLDTRTGEMSGGEAGAPGLTLYDAAGFNGAGKTFSGDAANLAPLGWNDLAASLQVRGGTWEVCEDADFHGQCRFIADDEANLGDEGWSGRISSLRRVN